MWDLPPFFSTANIDLVSYLGKVKTARRNWTQPRMQTTVSHGHRTLTIIGDTDFWIAKEIEELRREAEALKEIRNSMGSADFCRKVFEKVFKDDIERLRGMDEAWKERPMPDTLDYEKLQEESASVEPSISIIDQRVWTLAESFAVFKDR
jgi:hypothetical protein